jgi:hypothetical protein
VELGSSFSALLEFTLKTAQDVIKSETAFAGRPHASSHAAHTDKALGLHGGTTLRTIIRLSAVKAESIARTLALVGVLVMIRKGVARRVLSLLLLLFMACSVLDVLLRKYTEDTGSDLVMNDCLVVLANDINAKFLMNNKVES